MGKDKKFTEADKIIYMNLGEGARYLYEEDFDDLVKAVSRNESEKFYEWIKPKLKEIDLKKKEESNAFTHIVEIIKKNNVEQSDRIINLFRNLNESFKDFIDIIMGEKTNEETFSITQQILLISNIGFMPQTSAMRGGEVKTIDSVTFETGNDNYPVKVLFHDGLNDIEIECDDESSEFFIIDEDIVKSANPIESKVVFRNLEPGKYILSMDMKDFIEITVKESN